MALDSFNIVLVNFLMMLSPFSDELASFEQPSKCFEFGAQLGEGQFGVVLRAEYKKLPPNSTLKQVVNVFRSCD